MGNILTMVEQLAYFLITVLFIYFYHQLQFVSLKYISVPLLESQILIWSPMSSKNFNFNLQFTYFGVAYTVK